MGFTFMTWNVRNFRGTPTRVRQVSRLIKSLDPDILGLIEFRGKEHVRTLIHKRFQRYDFGVTDSRQNLELLVGYRRGKFKQVIFTQRREFRAGSVFLRPGGLLSVRTGNRYFNLLFLHTKSGTSAADYNGRQKMFKKIWSMERSLRKLPAQKGSARLIVLGDLNTMGKGSTVSGEAEIRKLSKNAGRNRMRILDKDVFNTWHAHTVGGRRNSRPITVADLPSAKKSDLDHVIASDDLRFRVQAVWNNGDPAYIHVKGWNQLQGADRVGFLRNISDHSILYGELI